jgi:hypothetical protein
MEEWKSGIMEWWVYNDRRFPCFCPLFIIKEIVELFMIKPVMIP